MFSREESASIRKEFWTSFGKSFPRKWILYNTKIKGFSFKFVADYKTAMVVLDITSNNAIKNKLLYDQITALQTILRNEFIPGIVFDNSYVLETGKHIYRIYCQHSVKFNIHNKNTWRDAYEFFNLTMDKYEQFYVEYEDFIKSAI